MIKKAKIIFIAILVLSLSIFVGCNKGNSTNYFEYLNSNSVEQISIQSTRDPGFKFIVTEESSIKDLYNLLSKAKVAENKSPLEADYIFEFDIGDEVKDFYYVVGGDSGNFYDEVNIYTVSKRIDEGIMKNLSFVRKPRDFDYVYYSSILDVLKKANEIYDISKYNIGINIKGDIDCLKYVFSYDLDNFLKSARKITPNIELINNNENEFDIVVTVKNRGYDTTNFKTLITINNKKENTEQKYYVVATNKFKEWNIKVTGPNPDMPPNEW